FIKMNELESVCLPFLCPSCDKESAKTVQVQKIGSNRDSLIQEQPCPDCGKVMEFDDDPDEFFSFANRVEASEGRQLILISDHADDRHFAGNIAKKIEAELFVTEDIAEAAKRMAPDRTTLIVSIPSDEHYEKFSKAFQELIGETDGKLNPYHVH